jgi:hypothetical protein
MVKNIKSISKARLRNIFINLLNGTFLKHSPVLSKQELIFTSLYLFVHNFVVLAVL